MKYGLLAMVLFLSLVTIGAQSGRVRRDKNDEKPPSEAELLLKLDASRPVLVNMTREDLQACGLNKLSEEELDHLDRWFLDLLVKLQSLPQNRTLKFEKPEQDQARMQELERQRQNLEARVRDLQSRLSMINQEATRMTFDVNSARLAASRRDWSGVHSSLLGLESSLRRIKQASQP